MEMKKLRTKVRTMILATTVVDDILEILVAVDVKEKR